MLAAMRPSAESDMFGMLAAAEVDRYLALVALARGAGADSARAGEIAKLVVGEFFDVPVNLESAAAVVARVEELAGEE